MTQGEQLTQTIVYQNLSVSVVTEPVFTWKFYEDFSAKRFVDKRSKLKGKFIGERFVHVGSEVQLRSVVRHQNVGSAAWNGYVFLFILILIVMLKRMVTRKYNQLLMCLTGNTNLSLMLREWNPMKTSLSLVVVFVYIASFSLLIQNALSFMSSYSASNAADFFQFVMIFAGLTVLFTFKYIIIRFFSYLFKTHDETGSYLANHLGYFADVGLVLMPILLVMLYNPSEYIIYFGAIIISILMIIKVVRCFASGFLHAPFSILFLFLYLCALEIMPLLVFAKIIFLLSNGERIE